MKKLFLTSITTIALTVPAIADPVVPNISPNSESADCTQPVLGTTTGTSNLQASWTPNTLNIDWYNGETKLTSNTCTYDSGITVPSTNPSKEGYTFAGWTVRTAVATQCSFDGLLDAEYIVGMIDFNARGTRWKQISSNSNQTMMDAFGEENSSDLNNGEWEVSVNYYGKIKGQALCSATQPDDEGYTFDINENTVGQYCWCRINYFKEKNSNDYCTFINNPWVYQDNGTGSSWCSDFCASACADYINNDYGFATMLIGQEME